MTIGSWLLLSIIWWFGGYFNMWYLEPSQRTKLVYVPKWMFTLFGAPRHKNVPFTVQPVRSVYLQVMGITLALYGILLDQRLINDPNLSGLLGFGVSMLFGIIVSQWLSRRRPYLWQNDAEEDEGS